MTDSRLPRAQGDAGSSAILDVNTTAALDALARETFLPRARIVNVLLRGLLRTGSPLEIAMVEALIRRTFPEVHRADG